MDVPMTLSCISVDFVYLFFFYGIVSREYVKAHYLLMRCV
ncbi:hypothetical protein BTN50_0464 [Candidatus Enterovibrio altilux]|uniref:Uncharacterized protein n=1 Tax=Candidatus Enterovibrio altilux TaxID=1927128 RepID=A0A291B7M0_9GAMM|nr:hypothetical protein BTN50_0464 [Candidatus Enterovibrio luxaltus]